VRNRAVSKQGSGEEEREGFVGVGEEVAGSEGLAGRFDPLQHRPASRLRR
jgi:hypothetical protein